MQNFGKDLKADLMKFILNEAMEGICIIDSDLKITLWNKKAEVLTGWDEKDVLGRDVREILFPSSEIGIDVERRFLNCFSEMSPLYEKITFEDKQKLSKILEIKVVPLKVSGSPCRGIIYFNEFTHAYLQFEKVRELEKMAMLDPLTGLGNRRFLEMKLSEALIEKEFFGVNGAFVFMDVDYFKNINDRYGHDGGDRVLLSLSRVLVNTFMPNDYVGRWGGDEFGVVLISIDPVFITHVMERLYSHIRTTEVILNGDKVILSVSAGVTPLYKRDSIDSVFRRVDAKLYEAKKKGGDNFIISD
jgi:diguanylate cyclase (GGDEF)-like protein/PAS domain S-box-containing protein